MNRPNGACRKSSKRKRLVPECHQSLTIGREDFAGLVAVEQLRQCGDVVRGLFGHADDLSLALAVGLTPEQGVR